MALNSGIQAYQILTDDDEVCMPGPLFHKIVTGRSGTLFLPYQKNSNFGYINFGGL